MTTVRSEIPSEYKWDLTNIYADREAFETAYEEASGKIHEFPKQSQTMCNSAEELYAMFCDLTELRRMVNKLYSYASLNSDVDLSDNTFLTIKGKVMNLYNEFGSATFFVDTNLLKIDEKTYEKWMKEFPKLKEYQRAIYLSQRYRDHILPDEGEKLLADLRNCMDTHGGIRSVFANADLKFGKIKDSEGKSVELTDTSYIPLMMGTDRRVRKAAFTKLYATYEQFGNTFASLLDGFVKEMTTTAKVRHFENSQEASVFNDEVPSTIYHNLVETVNSNLKPLFQYYEIKRKALGLSKLHLYDIYSPLITSCDKKYTYEEAVETVLDALQVLGKEYHDTLEDGLKNRHWADVYPNTGKRGGAYSGGCFDTEPYILLNFSGSYDSVSTLAHEAGHSMHTWFSKKNNTPQEADYTIFVAEVASTVNELILAHKKLKESNDDEEKLYILNELMETYKGTLFRQTMFAEFEQRMHALNEQGEPLTKDLLCKEYYELVCRYFGKDVVCDHQISCEWMRIPHFYYNFYVYKYATCISAASSIVKKIETEGEAYIGKYLKFLSCGGSRSPLDSLLVADIDMTSPNVVLDAIADFSDTVAQFQNLYEKKASR